MERQTRVGYVWARKKSDSVNNETRCRACARRKLAVISDPSEVSTTEDSGSRVGKGGFSLMLISAANIRCPAAKLLPANLQNFHFRVAYFPRSLASKSILKSLSVSFGKLCENLIASKFSDCETGRYSLRTLFMKLIMSVNKKKDERTDTIGFLITKIEFIQIL